jgi:uncharacterized protein YabE (DUF348 family)
VHHPRSTTPRQTPGSSPRNRHRQTTKRVVIALNLAVLLVIGLGATAYGVLGKTVTLDVDGRKDTVRTFGASVGSLLESQDVSTRDAAVSARPTEPVADGDTIRVRYAKDVTLAVDGKVERRTVHAATVGDVLDDLDVAPKRGAEMNADRDTRLGETGGAVVVSNPKRLTVEADGDERTVTSAAPTAEQVLEDAGVRLGASDEVVTGKAIGRDVLVKPGDDVKAVRIDMVDRTEKVERDPKVVYRDDDSMEKGTEKVLEPGKGARLEQQVLITKADGKTRHRLVLTSRTVSKGEPRVVARGTAEAPSVEDGSVWDRIAQCESGGNWSINTGNGYYGGLQFSAATWHSVGGPGLPHEHSREVQIKYAKILQQRSGWGQWSCASKVGVG